MYKSVSKILISIFCFISLLSLSSCDYLRTDDEKAEEMIQELITALDNKDKEDIKNLFAQGQIHDIENFDDSIDDLLDYYQGTYEEKKSGGRGEDNDKHYEYRASWYNLSYDVTTSNEIYRIAIYWCIEHTIDENMIGIWSLYIIKMDDCPTPEYSYRGDGLWTPGINIGKVYIESIG